MLNEELAEERGISKEDREVIKKLHDERDSIFLSAEKIVATGYKKDTNLLKELFSDWLDIERSLQGMWKFEQDDKYIRFWDFPACSCPSLDNDDAYPTGYYTISGGCLIHGEEVNNKVKESGDVCEHGKKLNDYCEPCGRIHTV